MPKHQKQNYKWIVFGVCFLMAFVSLGFCSGNKGLYLTPITEALGIKRSLFSFNDSFRYVSTAVINLFFGSLIQRFGIRKMTAFGFVSLIASTLLYAYADHIVLFYLGGVLLGIGLSFTSTTMASILIRRFFKTNVGKYTGIVLAANGIGGAVAAQLVSPLIESGPFGYRSSYLLVAIILFFTGVLAVALIREKPDNEEKEETTPSQKKKSRGESWSGIDLRTAKTKSYFYLALISVFFTGCMLQAICGVYAAHMKDVGISSSVVASVVSVFSLALTASKILVGALYDRFGLRSVMLICQGATVVSFLLLAVLNGSSVSIVFAFVFALVYALALPLETLVLPLITNDLFGSLHYDRFLGIVVAMNYAGFAAGAPLVNLCYDLLGTYKPILLIFSVCVIPIAIAFQFVLGSVKKEKEAMLLEEKKTETYASK